MQMASAYSIVCIVSKLHDKIVIYSRDTLHVANNTLIDPMLNDNYMYNIISLV